MKHGQPHVFLMSDLEPADSPIDTLQHAVPTDLELSDPFDATTPALEVFDAFDVAPTWVDAMRDDESDAA
jgi:hypothetical protein